MKRIAILTNIIPPYRLPLFNGIAKTYKLDVLVCKENEKNRKWKIEEKNLFNTIKLKGFELNLKNSLGDYRFVYLKFSIITYLIFKRPDYLIIGDASLTSYFAAFLCNILGIKYIWWNEILPFTPINKGLVEKLRRYSITHAYHHFVSGTLAKEFIESYGIPSSKVSIIPDAVDNQKYFDYYQQYKDKKEKIRKRYNISQDDFVYLYVGQFIKRKNLDIILKSFKLLHHEDQKVKLFLVGGGPEKEKIEKFRREYCLEDYIIVEDFLQEKELAQIYTISDALILLSESEPWGMVVNEAMCFGLPILTSSKVGASADLINEQCGVIIQEYTDYREVANGLRLLKETRWSTETIQNKIYEWNNEVAYREAIKNL